MKYEDIVLKKFVFLKTEVPQELQDHIWSLNYPDTGTSDGEIRYKIEKANDFTKIKILDFFKTIEMDSIIWDFVSKFDFDVNRMTKNEYVPMHNEISQRSPIEVVLWLTKTDIYEGRHFIMKGPSLDEKIQPTNGLVCFLDTTARDVYHGVSKLLTDTEIITITGGLGRKKLC